MSQDKCPVFYMSHDDRGVVVFLSALGFIHTKDLSDADFVVFPGGEDVTPFLYGERKHPKTHCNLERDLKEVKLFRSLPSSLPKVGICRGAQFLNVMSGGSLWQHVDHHATAKGHLAKDMYAKNSFFHVTSTHHQMMIPGPEAAVLAAASCSEYKHGDSRVCHFPENTNDFDDPEVVYYAGTNSICYQPHPEYAGSANKANQEFFLEVLETYVLTHSQCTAAKAVRTGRQQQQKKDA